MKHFTFLAILSISLSCQKNNTDQKNPDIFYSVDTVIINSKDRLLDLDYNIFISDLDYEESSIFLFNKFNHSFDEVNLNNLEVVNNYSFDSEGPNGTGEHVNFINILKDDLIFIKSFGKSALFQKNGSLRKKVDWENASDSIGSEYGGIRKNELAVGSSDLKVFGLSYDNKKSEVWLDVLSVQDNTVKRFDIDPLNSYHNFVLQVDDPQDFTFLDPIVFLMYENNLITISHQFSNEIYLYNSEVKQIQTIYYEPKLTPKRAKDLSRKITSHKQLQKEYQYFVEQVKFGPPVWDKVEKRYFRLSKSVVFLETSKDEHSFLPETKEVKVFLSVFDVDFNLISELAIPELNTEYVKYFAKDGKLWVFKNFSDELGFIIIDI